MSESKSALIIANFRYEDPDLRQLVAPAEDAQSLARVLADPTLGGFEVRTLINEPSHKVCQEIEDFCENRKRDDLLVLYFSGHGIKDVDGQLYFAATNTRLVEHNLRCSTAVSAQFVNEMMSRSRSRRQILLLDCCYSGAFKEGMMAKAGKQAGAAEQLEGQGRIVLTASDALQYSFEGERVEGEGVRSIFTRILVHGLETGEADLDRDGLFSLDEVYNYVFDRVTDEQPGQKPTKMGYAEGRLFIGSNPRPLAAALPSELQETLEDRRPWVRRGAVMELETLLASNNRGMVLAAEKALAERAAGDDSADIQKLAAGILASRGSASVPADIPAPEPGSPPAAAELAASPQTSRPSKKIQSKTKTATRRLTSAVQSVRGVELMTLRGHSNRVHCVAWNSTGSLLATGAEAVKIWDTENWTELSTFGERESPSRPDMPAQKVRYAEITSIDWGSTPNDDRVATANTNLEVMIWNAVTGDLKRYLAGYGSPVAWRPTGIWLTTGPWLASQAPYDFSNLDGLRDTDRLLVKSILTGECLPIHCSDSVTSLAWSPNGQFLAMGSFVGEKFTKIWHADTGTLKHTLACKGAVFGVSWHPGGTRLATASCDGTARVWDTVTGKRVLSLSVAEKGEENDVWDVSWNPNGRWLATGSEDGTARVWDVTSGKELVKLRHDGPVHSVAWSPDGTRLATGSYDQTAKIWGIDE